MVVVPAQSPEEELLEIADRLERVVQSAAEPEVREPLERLEQVANRVAKAWSGSFLGYHARIYYRDFSPPPPGAHFSPEWGLKDSWPVVATQGEWVEYDPDDVERKIYELAGHPDLRPAQRLAQTAGSSF